MSILKMSRRQFVQTSGAAAGALALGSVATTGCGGKYPTVQMTDEKLVIDLEQFPELKTVNEGMLFQVPNNVENIVVVHTEGGFVATGAQCPHQGCSVRWQKDKKLLVCPCHKSAYEVDGTCARGPGWSKAQSCEEFGKRLRPYSAVEEGGSVIVTAVDSD